MRLPCAFAATLLLAMPALADSPPPAQSAASATVQASFTYPYLLALPPGYDRAPDRRWPLLIFLHGMGQRGTDLAKVHLHGPPHLVDQGRTFPFILISPQCPEDEWWNLSGIEAFIAAMVEKYRVDPDRVYLTGMSMGGYGVWSLALRHPERYAAIAPICGGGEPKWAARLRDLPVWAFHGAKDHTVPPKDSREMIDAITAAGGHPRLTLYPDAGHDAWTATYANDELYTWLLAQRRHPVIPPPASR